RGRVVRREVPNRVGPPQRLTISRAWPLAPITSPLEGEVGSRAMLPSPEGGTRAAESDKYPPPHPSPPRGEGGHCRSLTANQICPARRQRECSPLHRVIAGPFRRRAGRTRVLPRARENRNPGTPARAAPDRRPPV